MTIRIIPRLDVKGPNLVKGVHMEGLRVLGLPNFYASRYYQDGADEIIYLDTVASLYGRNNLADVVSRAAEHIFIPLTVGGGIRTVDDVRGLLRAGADKVAINTAAISNPQLIQDASRAFGSQCIVVYIEAKSQGHGHYECLTDNAREASGVDVIEWVQRAVDLGAGEVLLTSVDREGTGQGYDIELTAQVAELVPVPVIACGGAGNQQHIKEVIVEGKADAVCAASLFHYQLLREIPSSALESGEGNTEFLRRNLPNSSLTRRSITPSSVTELKSFLREEGISVREPRQDQEALRISAGGIGAGG